MEKRPSVVVPSRDPLRRYHHQRACPVLGEHRLEAARGLVTVVVAARDSPLELGAPRTARDSFDTRSLSCLVPSVVGRVRSVEAGTEGPQAGSL